MNRRSFFAALVGLPFVVKAAPSIGSQLREGTEPGGPFSVTFDGQSSFPGDWVFEKGDQDDRATAAVNWVFADRLENGTIQIRPPSA